MVKEIQNLKRYLFGEFKKAEGKFMLCRYYPTKKWYEKNEEEPTEFLYYIEAVKIFWDGDPTIHYRQVIEAQDEYARKMGWKIVFRKKGNISLGRRRYMKLKNGNWQSCEFGILNKKEFNRMMIIRSLEKNNEN